MDDAHLQLVEFWYAGLRAKVGVRIRVATDVSDFKARLLLERKRILDPALETLAIIGGASPDELWIVHKTFKLEDQDAEKEG